MFVNMSQPLTVIKDSVHGTITMPRCIMSCIDTVPFQRLRCIKQMGGKYFVYPGASHNRFEHSIGVCHIAGEFVKTMRNNQPELSITDEDVLCVMLAGLFHDLGHGPFSHVFDSMVVPLLDPGNPWKHEDASILMFDYMLDCPRLDGSTIRKVLQAQNLSELDFLFIKELILGCPLGQQHSAMDPREYEFQGRERNKWFLYEIVSNKYTSIDVDKWDYCARDCHGLRLSYDFDWKRYINGCLVLYDPTLNRNTICPLNKEVINLYDMFHAREMLHRKALQDVTCVSIELMLADALVSACRVLETGGMGIRSLLQVPGEEPTSNRDAGVAMATYCQLTDNVLSTISLVDKLSTERQGGVANKPSIAEQKRVTAVLTRINERRLYKCIGSICPLSDKDEEWKGSAEDIAKRLNSYLEMEGYSNEDFAIYVAKFDYCMQDRDPLSLLRTYIKGTREAISLTQEMKSRMLPGSFEEKRVRLYCKDYRKMNSLKRIFTSWCREHKIGLENEQFNSVSSIENPQDLLTGEIGTDDCFYN